MTVPSVVAGLRILNLGVRFVLELATLAALAYWAATLRAGVIVRVAATLLLPVAVGIVWGVFISPKARIPTGRLGQAGLGLIVFVIAAAALSVRGHLWLAQVFGAVAVVSSLLLYVLP